MKRIFTLIAAVAALSAASFAQYMPTVKGTVLTYEQKDLSDNKTETYTSTVTEVATDADGKITATLVEKHKVPGSAFDEIETTSSFTFNPADTLTVNILVTSEEFKRISLLSIKEMFAQAGQYPSEQDMAEIEKAIKPKGDIEVPLPANAVEGATFPNSSIRASLMGQSMGMKLVKGSYLGYEDVEVPAGNFHCLKVAYTMSIIGAGAPDTKATVWYAPKVGIVKDVTTDKKGKTLTESVLTKIAEP